MSEISRRDLLRRIGLTLMATGAIDRLSAQEVHHITLATQSAAGGAYTPKALNDHEYRTLEKLNAAVSHRVHFDCVGPLAPYSFVDLRL